jgi:NitT/TauT family transport system substrate-binding protein
VDGLGGVPIGISEGTVIEYLTDRLLEAEGLESEQIVTISVPRIPDRLALLSSGELEAAMLPDPLSFLAEQSGATIVLDDSSHPEYGYSVISFRAPFIDENPEAITGFLAAIEEATELINADPSKWDALLTEQKLVPESLQGSYRISPYPLASVPSEAQWDDVYAWAQQKGLIENEVSYESSVTDRYLP